MKAHEQAGNSPSPHLPAPCHFERSEKSSPRLHAEAHSNTLKPISSQKAPLNLIRTPAYNGYLICLNTRLAAALALLIRHQFALLHVKLFFLNDFPLMKTALTQGLALVLLLQRRLFESNHVTHDLPHIKPGIDQRGIHTIRHQKSMGNILTAARMK